MAVTARPDLRIANISASRARSVRAEWLASLQFGLCSVTDIMTYACEPEGRPLLRLGLVRLLSEQDGWSRQRAVDVVNQMLRLLGQKQVPVRTVTKLNVQWLVDARTGGRRQLALADAMDLKEEQPWAGFPYSSPTRGA